MKNLAPLSLTLVLTAVLAGCSGPRQSPPPAEKSAKDGPSIRLRAEQVKPGLHVDLKLNGDIWISEDEESFRKITVPELKEQLSKVKEKGTFVFYTRESPTQDPPARILETFEMIMIYGVPIKMLDGPPAP